MKAAIKTLGLALALAVPAVLAQPNAGEKLDRLKAELKLSPEQSVQVKKILDEFEPQWKALHEQKRALHDQMHSRLKTVLNKEQGEKLDKMAEERRARHRREWESKPEAAAPGKSQ